MLNTVVLGASAEGGSGWRIAEQLAERGAHVTVGARRIEGVNKLATAIGGTAVHCDAASESDIEAMSLTATQKGPIDLAILAAGQAPVGSIDQIAAKDIELGCAINYYGPVYFIRHMARKMKDGGSIVLIGSLSADRPTPGYFAYACPRAALQTLIKYAALEYAPRGIRINAIAPGLIASPMAADLLSKPEALKAMLREIPLRRPVDPREVAETAIWVGLRATATTGEYFYVDNGMHLLRSPQPDEISEALLLVNAREGGYATDLV